MARQDEALVTIAVFDTEFEASLARGALEAIGIPAFVPGEAGGSFAGLYGARLPNTASYLRVFESDRERAAVELRRMQMRIAKPPDDDDDPS